MTVPRDLADLFRRRGVERSCRAAFVAVDLQNDFCAPDGLVLKSAYAEDPAAIAQAALRCAELSGELQRAGVPCIFVRSFMDRKYKLPNLLRRHRALGISSEICRENTWGAEFYKVRPDESACVVTKHTNDAFLYTFLEPLLRKVDVDTVILSGVYTELCIEDTARSAIQRGFHVVVPEDCTAGLSTACVQASLETMRAFQIDILPASTLASAASAARGFLAGAERPRSVGRHHAPHEPVS